MNKLIFFVALFLCVGIWGCEDKEDKYTKNDDQSIVGTWKCIGFGNTETNEIKPIEPQNCEKCYTITFKENGTFFGMVAANSISGRYTIHFKSINFIDVLTTDINEPYDGGFFKNIISRSKINNHKFSKKEELLLYYNDKKEYLLFNLKNKKL